MGHILVNIWSALVELVSVITENLFFFGDESEQTKQLIKIGCLILIILIVGFIIYSLISD
jgi:hypothetical protein